SYEVTLRFAGRERTYRALVLQHNGFQSASEPRLEFADNIVGQTPLTNVYYERRPPVRASWLNYVRTEEYRRFAAAAKSSDILGLQNGPDSWPGSWRSKDNDLEISSRRGTGGKDSTSVCDTDGAICVLLCC